ncbi:MAG: hypothetical protein H8E27_03320 [Verrucomicrobia subdivision 3 bacterium]|nr:hypothetical protein [Limisphaerales bacterium]
MITLSHAAGCLSIKYNSAQEIIQAHPLGFQDAINASHHARRTEESKHFIQALLRRLNQLEARLEAEGQ